MGTRRSVFPSESTWRKKKGEEQGKWHFGKKPWTVTECGTLVPLSSSEISNPKRQCLFFISPLKGNGFSNAAPTGSCLEPRNNLLNTCWLRNFREGDISNVVACSTCAAPGKNMTKMSDFKMLYEGKAMEEKSKDQYHLMISKKE